MKKHIQCSTITPSLLGQLGFDLLLGEADEANRQHQFERETGHLPSTMEEAVPYFRALLERHHESLLQGDVERVMKLREEARHLALRLNKGDPGIVADEGSSGRMLERVTAASFDQIPIWGQRGDFEIEARGVKVRIEINGFFGIGSSACFWPGFAAHAVEFGKPFISETGYRSFLGHYAEPASAITPDLYARTVIETHIEMHLKGKLLRIEPCYRNTSSHEHISQEGSGLSRIFVLLIGSYSHTCAQAAEVMSSAAHSPIRALSALYPSTTLETQERFRARRGGEDI